LNRTESGFTVVPELGVAIARGLLGVLTKCLVCVLHVWAGVAPLLARADDNDAQLIVAEQYGFVA